MKKSILLLVPVLTAILLLNTFCAFGNESKGGQSVEDGIYLIHRIGVSKKSIKPIEEGRATHSIQFAIH